MKTPEQLYIFGEVLFDCFPSGEQTLGGAPFNVAWHLQAFGDSPRLISRVGQDQRGEQILQAMRSWGLTTAAVQVDAEHPTGRVEVTISDGEPAYDIVANSAFDFIAAEHRHDPSAAGILYHGTLCLRNARSRGALRDIVGTGQLKVFLDVNLRSPWWQPDEVRHWLQAATWVKMNQQELALLDGQTADIRQQMAALQTRYGLDQLIVTRGEQGALIRTASGQFHSRVPEKSAPLVDSVGAGDAFSAVFIHGLRNGWSTAETLLQAQRFASKIIGVRGATTSDPAFYQQFMNSLES